MWRGVGSIFAVDGNHNIINRNEVRSVQTGVRLDRQPGSNEIFNLQIQLNGIRDMPSTVSTVIIPQNDLPDINEIIMRDAFRRSFETGQNAHVYISRNSNGK